jgi:hypothetical protein
VSYTIRWPQARLQPYDHQREGVRKLLQNPAYALFDEMGVGKSKQVVDTACVLYEHGEIDTLIIVCPAFARSVWSSPDPVLGEFAKHVWKSIPYRIDEYSSKNPKLPPPVEILKVIVTNPEFLRVLTRDPLLKQKRIPFLDKTVHLKPIVAYAAARKTWLVVDESWMVQAPDADQTKAVERLARKCLRVTLLNGTPGNPYQLYSQFRILNPDIFDDAPNAFTFKRRYCLMGGYMAKQIVGYQREEEFRRRTAPYAVRRLAAECLDLPPVLEPITIEARLTPATWKIYKTMRDELVVWLSKSEASISAQAGVRTLRLRQILAGFLGGVQSFGEDLFPSEHEWAGHFTDCAAAKCVDCEPPCDCTCESVRRQQATREIGREKLDAVLAFVEAQDVQKGVIWCGFRPEMARMAEALRKTDRTVHLLQGQQDTDEREQAKMAFAPGGDPAPAWLVGHPQAGGAGINLAAASLAIYVTNTSSLLLRQQSEKRIDRPGQTQRCRFVDVVAVGPDGQKTVDHAIAKALRAREEIANYTAATWRQILEEE